MNLLLLLSALFSALTGAASTVREPTAAHAISAVAVCAQAVKAVQVASRPVQPLATLGTVALPVTGGEALFLAVAEPLYASRRRE